MRRKNLVFLLVTLALLLPSSLIAADPGWIEIRTQHFRVVTDAGEKNGRLVAQRFEQMRSAFALIFGRKTLNEPVPITVIGFRNTKEFRQYSPIFQGKVVELVGFFVPAADENFVAVDMGRENSWEIVKHEYAHALLNANYMETAPWFDEGFAEFFSSLKLSDTEAQIGAGIPEAAVLVQGKKLGLQELFEVQHYSETYNKSGQRRDMFYVQSWLAVHYLFDTDLAAKASRYFALTNNQKVPVADAVKVAFGMSLPELEKAMLDYLRANRVKARVFNLKDQTAVSLDVTVRTLAPLEVRAQLADLHLHQKDYGAAAIKEYEAIIAENPNLAEAQRGLGYAYLRERDFPKATEHLSAAVRLGSKDPKVYFYNAELMQQENPAAMTSPDLVHNLRRAIELDPQYADAYAMLGTSLMESRSDAEAESNLARAVALSPRNDMYRLNYGIVLLNQQKFAQGKTTLALVLHSSNPLVADQAAQMLKEVNDHENRKAPEVAMEIPSRAEPSPPASAVAEPSAPPAPAKVAYLQGTLANIDCSSPPLATLTVTAGASTWKMKVADTEHMIVIGADRFSCSWTQRKVALNYSPIATHEGKVISLEIQ